MMLRVPCGPIIKSIHSWRDIHWIWASKAAPFFQMHLCGQRAGTVCIHEFESGLRTDAAHTKLNRLNFQLGTEFNWPTNCMAYVYKNFKSDPYWIFGSNTRIPKKLRCANASCHMFPCFHAMNESDSQIWTFRVPKRSSRNVLTRSTRWSLMYSRKLRNPTRNVVGTISWGVRWKYALKMLKPDSNSVATNKHEPLPWIYTDSFFF